MERREFLKSTACCGLALAFGGPFVDLPANAAEPRRTAAGRAWEAFYRDRFRASRGDAQGFAFHCSNCQGNCAWKVYAKNGVVTREEQSASYPPISPDIPDANPRGCNKG
ncbi:MAG: twin-arginine translocation signal domain-containing protein, partial [Candidatus Thermoplasmatota archaeon]|nr:twin-arginine translocation signal domain-containing protein [Candidatus Thermoplasmatota archaeon]